MKMTKEQISQKLQDNIFKTVFNGKTSEWEKFPNKGNDRSYFPRVSINEKGMLRFNKAATETLGLNEFDRCFLHYRQEDKLIGVTLTNESTDKSSLNLKRILGYREINIKKFMEHFKLVLTGTASYDVRKENEYIIVDLNKKVDAGRWGKKTNE